MSTINATQSGSKTLLAHFHYVCKGNVPFQPGFDWTSETAQTMAQLDADQMAIIQSLLQDLKDKGKQYTKSLTVMKLKLNRNTSCRIEQCERGSLR